MNIVSVITTRTAANGRAGERRVAPAPASGKGEGAIGLTNGGGSPPPSSDAFIPAAAGCWDCSVVRLFAASRSEALLVMASPSACEGVWLWTSVASSAAYRDASLLFPSAMAAIMA